MKKSIILFLTALMCLIGISAQADGTSINCLIENGSYIIQIDDPEGDLGWVADDMAQDDSVVRLYDADLIEDTFVVRYDPVGDGDVTVGVRHFSGIACDEVHTFDLHVENGAVTESTGGSFTASPDPTEQDPLIIGKWLEKDTQFTQMTIEKNPDGKAWDVEILSPLTHGAYIFKATIYYDCELDSFVYDKGKIWDVPITEEENPELGEAKIAGSTGSFTIGGTEEALTLTWYSDVNPEDRVVFEKSKAFSIDYGTSKLYSEADMNEAIDQILSSFLCKDGCKINSIRYAGDENNTEENIAWLNDHQIAEGKTYTQCAMFLVDFHSPVDETYQGSLNLDSEYQDYNFWFAREDGGNWDLVDMGY